MARPDCPLVLGAALPIGAVAAEETLQEVIITATPLRTTALETAQPILLLSGDQLRRALATNLGDTLANQPGVSSTSFGPIASRPIIRGQGGLRVQVYQDGAEALDVSALSEDHAVSLDPSFANRIEILHGPAALMYGSASAAGAINVVTDRLALQKLDQPIATRLELRGDSANEERALALRSGGDLGGNWQWRFDGFSRRSGDLSIADFVESPALRAALAAEGEEVNDERGEYTTPTHGARVAASASVGAENALPLHFRSTATAATMDCPRRTCACPRRGRTRR